jgi:hypothetical protein
LPVVDRITKAAGGRITEAARGHEAVQQVISPRTE